MEGGLKQRLVGALVLIALAVIFVPMVFERQALDDPREVIEIPPEPEFPQVAIETEEISLPVFVDEVVADTPDKTLDENPWLVPTDPVAPDEPAEGLSSWETAAAENSASAVTVTQPASVEAAVEIPVEGAPLDEKGLPLAWSVQLGVFGKPENARGLTERLVEAGYKAYSRELKTDGNALTRVLVGPTFDRSEAESWKTGLDSRFKLETRIVRYRVAG